MSSAPTETGPSEAGAAKPIYFGPQARPLFGWLHVPAGRAAHSAALVICNAYGGEAVSSHHAIRELAELAARRNMPALRFDYDGTGDSYGHDAEPGRVMAWMASIEAAMETLRETTAAADVYLVGIRLGSLLAAAVASDRPDVAGLAAFAPVTSGRVFVRESRMLQNAMAFQRGASSPQSADLRVAGFLLTRQTQESLEKIDLLRIERPPAKRVLLLDRAEMPGAAAWKSHLEALGGDVTHRLVEGFADMMVDAHESVVPWDALRAIVDWVAAAPAEPSSGRAPAPRAGPLPAISPPRGDVELPALCVPEPTIESSRAVPIHEAAVRFGPDARIFGIVGSPGGDRAAAEPRNAVLLLNAGAVHHIGPHRLYVPIARHLAAEGFTVLRMDISGLGDSRLPPGHRESRVYPQFAIEDVSAAIEFLRTEYAVTDVHVAGLCSGAYHGFKATVAALPVATAILINPLTFFWKEGMSLKYPPHRVAAAIAAYRTNVFSTVSWRKVLHGRSDLVRVATVLAYRAKEIVVSGLRALARMVRIRLEEDLPRELTAAAGSVDLQFVFAAGDPGIELLRIQGGGTYRRLRDRGAIGIHLIPDADHTFTDLDKRRQLAGTLFRILRS